jgi:hypothetical protein
MLKSVELTDPNSCMSQALTFERMFVLLGRDKCSPAAIRYWVALRLGVVPLRCPPEFQTATGFFEPAGYDKNDCAGCGCSQQMHIEIQMPAVPDDHPDRAQLLSALREANDMERERGAVRQALGKPA